MRASPFFFVPKRKVTKEKAFFRIAPREKKARLRVGLHATGPTHYDGALPGFFVLMSKVYE